MLFFVLVLHHEDKVFGMKAVFPSKFSISQGCGRIRVRFMPIKPTPTIPILTIAKSLSDFSLAACVAARKMTGWGLFLEALRPFCAAFLVHFSGPRPRYLICSF